MTGDRTRNTITLTLRIVPIAVLAYIAMFVLLTLLTACALPMNQQAQSSSRESVAGKVASDLAERTFTQATPTKIEVPQAAGAPLTVEVGQQLNTTRSAAADADERSETTADWAFKQSLPWGVALLITVVAIGLALKLASKSKAASAMGNMADDYMARMVGKIKSRAASSTNVDVTKELLGAAADVSDDRSEWNRD